MLTLVKLEGWRAKVVGCAEFKQVRVCGMTKRSWRSELFDNSISREMVQLSIIVGIGSRNNSETMGLRQAAQHVKSCNPYLRRPNAEISRFVRARPHGTSFYAVAARTKLSTRNFASISETDANTQGILDDYKKSCKANSIDDVMLEHFELIFVSSATGLA